MGRNDHADPEIRRYERRDDFIRALTSLRPSLEEREVYARSFIPPSGGAFTVSGFCRACGAPSVFRAEAHEGHAGSAPPSTNWRESLICGRCGLCSRLRAAADILLHILRPSSQSRIFATEAVTPFFAWLSRRFPQSIGSEYEPGRVRPGLRHEDLTRLSFDDGSFDILLSFDVLEHIFDYRTALAECLRVMAPGARALISVPFLPNSEETLVRARLRSDGATEHLLQPEYHGDPLGGGSGCLCYYHFGWDLLGDSRALGARRAELLTCYSSAFGYLGTIEYIVLYK